MTGKGMAGALAAAALLGTAAPAAADRYTAGSPGLGDSLFPLAGNGGYDVRHYDLDLAYDYRTQVLDGSVRIRARATQDLNRFDLDLRGFDIAALSVDRHRARHTREGQELIITPRRKLKAGEIFTVRVDYAGVPETVIDPDESSEGWARRTTAPRSSTSRRDLPAGTRPTTTRATRRPSTSASPCPRARPPWPTASCSAGARAQD